MNAYDEYDNVIIAGDWNARIGTRNHFIVDIDDVIERRCIDSVLYEHGDHLLNFPTDTHLMVLNGHINKDLDNFTSITGNGTAIVDYICTCQECLDIFF